MCDCCEEFIEEKPKFDPIELELEKTYIQHKGTWQESHYKIIFIDDKIALGTSVFSKVVLSVGNYDTFHRKTGLRYNENRLSYRLSEEVK